MSSTADPATIRREGAPATEVEPIVPAPPRPVSRPVMLQRWNDITWLHWPYRPEVVQAALPPGVRLDTFDGQAWVGLVPFAMTRLRPPGLPPVPWVTTFPEINVRTYVVTPDGRRIGRLDHIFKEQLDVAEAQILQETPEAIEVRIARRDSYGEASERALRKEFRTRLGDAIRIDLRYVEAIPREPNGKFRAVKSVVGRNAP